MCLCKQGQQKHMQNVKVLCLLSRLPCIICLWSVLMVYDCFLVDNKCRVRFKSFEQISTRIPYESRPVVLEKYAGLPASFIQFYIGRAKLSTSMCCRLYLKIKCKYSGHGILYKRKNINTSIWKHSNVFTVRFIPASVWFVGILLVLVTRTRTRTNVSA